MQRQEIETAIAELDELLLSDVNEENKYQDWCEQHPVVLMVLGYTKNIPHPSIDQAGDRYIPDFLVEHPNGVWSVFELKTPQAEILKDLKRRNTFYASFEHYVSQVQDYSEVFDDPSTRAAFESKYGIKVQKRPHSTIVAGRNEGIDLAELFKLTSRRTPSVEVYTFDDLRRALEAHRTFYLGDYDKAKGLSLHATLMLHHPDQKFVNNHLFDLGIYPDHNRAAVFVNAEGYLRLSVWDSNGRLHEARSTLPLASEDLDSPRWFQFEVGVGDGFGFLGIQLDGKYQADIRVNDFPFELTYEHVLGSDWKGQASSWFSASEIMIYDRPLAFEEKVSLRRYAAERVQEAHAWIEFRGHKFMYTAGHPAATRPQTTGFPEKDSGGLVGPFSR